MNRKRLIALLSILSSCSFCFGQGSGYSGLFSKAGPIQYVDKRNLVIDGLEIRAGNNHCIALYNCHYVIIRNCKLGPSPAKLGIYLYGCSSITITNCTLENLASGLIASTCTGNIKFENNDVKNILGNSLGTEKSSGSMVQFINVSGAGNSISYNVCENFPDESSPEDVININQSNGTSESPIKVVGNWIRGGGPSGSGGGINLGDIGGSYQVAEENILVDPGQYGIGISGGHHLIMKNNKIVAKKQTFTNVGIVVCNWYSDDKIGCKDISVANNEINYINNMGFSNPLWNGNNCGDVDGWDTNTYNPRLKPNVLPKYILNRAGVNPPSWIFGWPKLDVIKKDGFTASVKLNEEGVCYYVVLKTGDVAPVPVQIKEGKDSSGKLLAWNLKGKIYCDNLQSEYKSTVTYLDENTNYIIYFVAENSDFGILNSNTMITFSTTMD